MAQDKLYHVSKNICKGQFSKFNLYQNYSLLIPTIALRLRYINTQLTVFDWKIAGAVVIKFAVDLMSLPINHGFLFIIDT